MLPLFIPLSDGAGFDGRNMTGNNSTNLSVKIDKDLKRAFHEKCVREGTTMRAWVEARVREWVMV